MNLLIHGFHAPEDLRALERIVKTPSVNHVIHIYAPPHSLKDNHFNIPIESIAFNHAGNGFYHLKDLIPVDGSLIEKMLPTEAIVMKQMDRLEIYDPQYSSYSARRSLYLKHLRFWNHVLIARKINLFIGSNIPHEVYDFVIFGLCRIYGIATHFLFQSAIPCTVHTLSDYTIFTPGLAKAFEHYQDAHRHTTSAEISLTPKLQHEWDRQSNNTVPFYMDQTPRFHPNNSLLNAEYESLTQDLERDIKYIYFPLHYQPELTTNPLGGAFVDQISALALLGKHVPPHYKIVVKEHPMQTWVGRGHNFYQNIVDQCKNVIFVNKSTSSHQLINNAIAVATITGTAGWEALFRKKPVLLFGNIFYELAPGVFKISSNDECLHAINDIIDNRFSYDERLLKLFLIALESTSITTIVDSLYRKESYIEPQILENNLVQHLSKVIEQVRLNCI
jgi:hypothetical protein